MTRHLISVVGSQKSKGGALGNLARRENGQVIKSGWDSRFYLGGAQQNSSTCTCNQLLFFHEGKPQDVYSPPFENHDLDIIKSLNKVENSNHAD